MVKEQGGGFPCLITFTMVWVEIPAYPRIDTENLTKMSTLVETAKNNFH